jgi:hypothetical protein
VLSDGTKTHIGDVNVWFTKCEVRADLVPDHTQAKRDHVVLACLYNLQFLKQHDSSQFWGEENLRLRLPDGTVIGSTQRDSTALYGTEILPDQYVAFQLPAPATGAYALQIIQKFADKPLKKDTLEVPLTL